MGIPVPSPDEPSGIACPYLGLVDMPPLWLTISGVITLPPEGWSPNGIHKLMPYWPCQWRKNIQGGSLYEREFVVTFYVNSSDVMVWWPQRFVFAYECTKPGHPLSGLNVFHPPAWYNGGSHQISFVELGLPYSLNDLVKDLQLTGLKKTFIEPIGGQNLDETATQRIARKHDGTCVYVKRILA